MTVLFIVVRLSHILRHNTFLTHVKIIPQFSYDIRVLFSQVYVRVIAYLSQCCYCYKNAGTCRIFRKPELSRLSQKCTNFITLKFIVSLRKLLQLLTNYVELLIISIRFVGNDPKENYRSFKPLTCNIEKYKSTSLPKENFCTSHVVHSSLNKTTLAHSCAADKSSPALHP